jgi:CheY-like chemotaxis protein
LAAKGIKVAVSSDAPNLSLGAGVMEMPKPLYAFPIVRILNGEDIGDADKQEKLVLKGISALVVDDEPMNLVVAASLFKEYQMIVDTADSGKEAIEKVKQAQYDVVFMDHMMPGMDGIEAFRKLREQDGPSKSAPVIALTANPDTDAKELYIKEGFSCFLKKPVKPALLEQALADFLPGELVERYSMQGEKEEGFNPEDHSIEGLDWDFAKIHFTDKDTMLETLNNFRLMISRDSGRLQAFYEEFKYMNTASPEDYVMSEYRVLVHSMKSSATLVGIIPLAGMALLLEKAAATGDLDTIRSLHDVFIRNWNAYEERLAPLFEKEEGSGGAEFDREVFIAHLDKLMEASEMLDVDTMDPEAKAVMATSLPWDGKKDVQTLLGAVAALDIVAINSVAEKLKAEAEKM